MENHRIPPNCANFKLGEWLVRKRPRQAARQARWWAFCNECRITFYFNWNFLADVAQNARMAINKLNTNGAMPQETVSSETCCICFRCHVRRQHLLPLVVVVIVVYCCLLLLLLLQLLLLPLLSTLTSVSSLSDWRIFCCLCCCRCLFCVTFHIVVSTRQLSFSWQFCSTPLASCTPCLIAAAPFLAAFKPVACET